MVILLLLCSSPGPSSGSLSTQLPWEARPQGFPYNCSKGKPGPRISVTSYSSLLLGILFTAPYFTLQWSQTHVDEDGAISLNLSIDCEPQEGKTGVSLPDMLQCLVQGQTQSRHSVKMLTHSRYSINMYDRKIEREKKPPQDQAL